MKYKRKTDQKKLRSIALGKDFTGFETPDLGQSRLDTPLVQDGYLQIHIVLYVQNDVVYFEVSP